MHHDVCVCFDCQCLSIGASKWCSEISSLFLIRCVRPAKRSSLACTKRCAVHAEPKSSRLIHASPQWSHHSEGGLHIGLGLQKKHISLKSNFSWASALKLYLQLQNVASQELRPLCKIALLHDRESDSGERLFALAHVDTCRADALPSAPSQRTVKRDVHAEVVRGSPTAQTVGRKMRRVQLQRHHALLPTLAEEIRRA